MRALGAGFALAVFTSAALPAQTTTPPPTDRVKVEVGGGMSRYGPQTFGSLEVAMNRWLAVRGEGLFSLQQRRDRPDHRFTALSLTSVLTLTREKRVTPYLFGGYALSASQGLGSGFGPLGGAGVRFRIGRFEPFMEVRAQHRIGVPISLGIRF